METDGFVGGEDLLTKDFLHFSNKMMVLVSQTKWPQSEVLQRQLLVHLKTHFLLIFSLKLNFEVVSRTNGRKVTF